MGPLIDAFFDRMERPGDSEYHRSQRRLIFTVWVVVSGGWLLAGLLSLDTARIGILQMGQLLGFVASLFGWVSLIFRIPMDYGDHTGLVCLLCALAILAGDVRAASDMRTRSWPLLVLLMDFMLVFKSRQAWQSVVISLTLTYLAVDAVETVVSFGFYEAGRYNEKSGEGRCSCSDPPCEIDPGAAGVGYVVALFIFLMDFYITRSFALRLRDQLNVVDASVNVAERVAQMLAMYATDDARKVLEDVGGCLPVPLLLAYEALLKNLDSYRAFLPDSLLYSRDELSTSSQSEWPRGDVSSRSSSSQPREAKRAHPCRPPPGIDDAGQVAVCFTDVQSSTELWETCPQGMYEGLNIHNGAIRDAYALCNGYEVKTIGDSFMGAWADPAGAVRFGVQVQEQLLDADWPEEPSFAMVHDKWATQVDQAGRLLWNGITVRIGISWGQVMEEVNPMTLRLDYRGPVVNLAARLESSAPHGSVHVSGGLYDELSGDQRLSNIEFTALGQVELKGLGAHTTYLASSQRLRGRVEYALQSTLSADRTRARSASRVFGDSAATSQLFKSSLWAANPLRRTSSKSVGSSGGSTVDESPRNSTRCNSSSSLGARRRRPGGTAQGMQTALASVAVVTDQLQSNAGQPRPLDGHSHGHSYHRDDVSDDPSNVTRWVVDCTTAAARTQGQVTTVMGPAAQVTWNAVGPPCPNHRAQLLLFMVVVNMGEGSAKSIAVGAGSGELLHGNTGFASQRFSIVAGLVPQLAHVLSATAAELGAPALAAFLPRLPPPLVPLTRPVDCWRVSMRDRATPVYILQPLLDLIGGRNAMELDGSSSMEQSMRRAHDLRGPRVHEAYDAVLQRADEEALGLFREAASSGADPVLSQVVLTLEEHVRTHPSGAQTRIPAPFVSPSGRLPSGAPARTQSPPQGARSVDRTASPLVLETAY
eukprot:TRINITY_DN7849_c0_g1_i3.p1 TRINITY_DN7849_c0_g1~~TRINITY_DN7849_c0_g1_i3.p1  ORF type:complete len:957 (+),score=228.31 TRINITY_DN7849_c0_g1_i3:78-2873(+)